MLKLKKLKKNDKYSIREINAIFFFKIFLNLKFEIYSILPIHC